MVSRRGPDRALRPALTLLTDPDHVCDHRLTNVSTDRLSPLVVPVDIVDILLTNVSVTPDFFGGGVSHFLRCAAPTLDLMNFDLTRLRELRDGAPQVPSVQVQIDLRRVEAPVTEQPLNVTDAGAVTQ